MGATTGTEIRFAGVARELERLHADLLEAAASVMSSGRLVLGEQVERLEHEFAAAAGGGHAVGVASGTDAIEIALRALGVGPGDEVVTQANTCVPTVAAIARAGARPVLCDADPRTGTLDAASLAAAIGPRTRAVVAVHLYGQCAPMEAVCGVAREHELSVVEDCAQALGATYGGRPAGTIGDLGCFSFYPTKNLGALGDGGAVLCTDEAIAARVRRLRVYGHDLGGEAIEAGVNSRLDELQAALLRVKLRGLADANSRRAEIAASYDAALAGTPVGPLAALPGTQHARHLYVVRAPDRERFRAALAGAGIETLVHYPRAVHQHAAYASLRDGVELRGAEALAATVVSLPLHPDLTDSEIDTVAGVAREAALEQEGA